MVFENLTLFEVSLDGAQIGPRSIGRSDETDDAEMAVEAPAAGGRGRFAPVFALGVMAGLFMLWRRSRRGQVEFELIDDAESEPEPETADAR